MLHPITNSFSARSLGVGDANGHGTCMANIVGGHLAGVTKRTNLIPVRWALGASNSPRAELLFESLLWILHDVLTKNMQGKAILNFSGGEHSFHALLGKGRRTDSSWQEI